MRNHTRPLSKLLLFVIGLFLIAQVVRAAERTKPSDSLANSNGEIGASALKGKMRYTIMVTEFENKALWQGTFSITQAWQEMLMAALHDDGRFIVLSDKDMRIEARTEQEFSESDWTQQGGNVAPKKGHMTSAQLLVRGTIVSVEQNVSGGGVSGILDKLPIPDLKGTAKRDNSRVTMIVQVFESQTGIMVSSKTVTGNSANTSASVWSIFTKSSNVDVYKKDNVAKACANALKEAVAVITDRLTDLQWTGTVIKVTKANDVLINRGEQEGILLGQQFIVGSGDALIDPDLGEFLGYDLAELATIEVSKVESKFSRCRVIKGDLAALKAGMMVWLPEE